MASNGSKYNQSGTIKDTGGFQNKDAVPKTVTTIEVNTKRLNVEEEAVINDISANSISTSQLIVNGLFKTTARSTIDINGLTSINNTVYVLTMAHFESELIKAAVTGGTSIVVAPGIFIVSSPLVVPANTDIRGSGINTTIFKARSGFGTSNPMFTISGSNSSISDLQYNGNGGTVGLLKLASVNFVFLDKIKFTNTLGTMLELESSTKANITNVLFTEKPSSAFSALYIHGNTSDCIFNNLYFIEIDENATNEAGAVIYIKPNGSSTVNTGTGVVSNILFSRIQISNCTLASSFRYRLISLNSDGDSSSIITKIQLSNIFITGIIVDESSIDNFTGAIATEGGSLIFLHKYANANISNILISEIDVSGITVPSGDLSGSIIQVANSSGFAGGYIRSISIEGVKAFNCDKITNVVLCTVGINKLVIDSVMYEGPVRLIAAIITFSSSISLMRFSGVENFENVVVTRIVVKHYSMLYMRGCKNVYISNVSFSGVYISNILVITECISTILSNVVIEYDIDHADYVPTPSAVPISVNGSSVICSNMHLNNISSSIVFSCTDITLSNLIIQVVDESNIADYVISISLIVFSPGAAFSKASSIDGCKIFGRPKSGDSIGIRIVPRWYHSIVISNNYISGSDTGIYIEGEILGSPAALYVNRDNLIVNNSIENHTNGIVVEDPSSSVVKGNIINSPVVSTGTGIEFSHVATNAIEPGNINVCDNTIAGHATGLSITYPVSGLYYHGTVTNNRIRDNTTANIAISHHVSNTLSELIVRDNNTVRTVTTATATVSIAQLDDRVYLDSTANAIAITLSDLELSYMGMRVTFYFSVRPGTNNVTITPGTTGVDLPGVAVYTTNIVLNAAGQQAVFEWTGSAWDLRGYSAAAVVT